MAARMGGVGLMRPSLVRPSYPNPPQKSGGHSSAGMPFGLPSSRLVDDQQGRPVAGPLRLSKVRLEPVLRVTVEHESLIRVFAVSPEPHGLGEVPRVAPLP